MNNNGIRANDPNPGGSSTPAQSTGLYKLISPTASPSPESSGRPKKIPESLKILESSVTNRHGITDTPATEVTHSSLSPGEALPSSAPNDFTPRSWVKYSESAGNPVLPDFNPPKDPSFEVFREFLDPPTDLRHLTTPKKGSDVQNKKFTSKKDSLLQVSPQDTLPPRPKTYRPPADGPWSTAQIEAPLAGSLWATADPDEDGPRATHIPARKPVASSLTSWVKPRTAPPPAVMLPVALGSARRPFLPKGGRSRSADGIVRGTHMMRGIEDLSVSPKLLTAVHAKVLGEPHASETQDRSSRADPAEESSSLKIGRAHV